MTPHPRNLSDEEIIRYVGLDANATECEKVLAERLGLARDYIAEIQHFLIVNNLAEEICVPIQ